MINLKEIENGKYTEFLYTFSDSIVNLKVLANKQVSFMLNMKGVSEINLEVEEGASVEFAELHYSSLDKGVTKRKTKVKGYLKQEIIYFSKVLENDSYLDAEVLGEGKYDLITLDFNGGSNKYIHNISLFSEGNEAHSYCASVVDQKFYKYIKNYIVNKSPNTIGIMENFGVSFDDGKLEIEGVGDIQKGARNSTNKQKSTMYVMDKTSKAISKPLLLIDEDEVVANHASAVGQISEDTIFYLNSRGIEESVARKLVVMGYFKPFIEMIKIDEVAQEIKKYLEEVINNV